MQVYSPQQEIFTACRQKAIEVVGKNNVYDFLPGEAKYPFIYIGEAFSTDIPNKSTVSGSVYQTIHFYHNDYKKRGTTERHIAELRGKIRQIERTPHFYITVISMNGRVLPDNTTQTPLLHGVLEIGFRFN